MVSGKNSRCQGALLKKTPINSVASTRQQMPAMVGKLWARAVWKRAHVKDDEPGQQGRRSGTGPGRMQSISCSRGHAVEIGPMLAFEQAEFPFGDGVIAQHQQHAARIFLHDRSVGVLGLLQDRLAVEGCSASGSCWLINST